MTATTHSRGTAHLDGYTRAHESAFSISSSQPVSIRRWHERLAHRNYQTINHLQQEGIVTDFNVLPGEGPSSKCEPCLDGKMTEAPHTKAASRADEPLGRVFSDLHRPVDLQSRAGYRYWVIFIDDHTRMVAIAFLKTKGEVFEAFKRYCAWAQNQMNRRSIEFDQDDH